MTVVTHVLPAAQHARLFVQKLVQLGTHAGRVMLGLWVSTEGASFALLRLTAMARPVEVVQAGDQAIPPRLLFEQLPFNKQCSSIGTQNNDYDCSTDGSKGESIILRLLHCRISSIMYFKFLGAVVSASSKKLFLNEICLLLMSLYPNVFFLYF